MLRIQIIIGTISITILLLVFELIRRKKLKEQYSLVWILTGAVMLLCSVFPQLLNSISGALGIYYLTGICIFSFLFLLLIVLHYSAIISQLSEKNTELAQEVGILTFRVEEVEKASGEEKKRIYGSGAVEEIEDLQIL